MPATKCTNLYQNNPGKSLMFEKTGIMGPTRFATRVVWMLVPQPDILTEFGALRPDPPDSVLASLAGNAAICLVEDIILASEASGARTAIKGYTGNHRLGQATLCEEDGSAG